MSEIKVGDRVKVERRMTVEGVVRYVSPYNGGVDLNLDSGKGFSSRDGDVITKLASPLKVGDTIEGEDAYEALPLGAVLDASVGTNAALFRTNAGFTDVHGNTYGPLAFYCPRRVAFLPTD